MKHFLVELKYLVPTEKLDTVVAEHRKYLQTGYDQGILLLSGPKIPRTGAFAVARVSSIEILREFFANDPYNKNHFVEYTFSEFNPVKYQPLLDNWINQE